MARDTRQRMIAAATALLQRRGYDGTGFREVVARAGAARGAIYHHFPEGKQQLGREVATGAGQLVTAEIRRLCAEHPPQEAVPLLLDLVELVLLPGDEVIGCPVAAVALAGEDPGGLLRQAADRSFVAWQEALRDCLVRSGAEPEEAARFALLAVSAVEGAALLSQAQRSGEPLRRLRHSLLPLVPRPSARSG